MLPIEVESLTTYYGRGLRKPKLKAVDGLTLSVEQGEVVGFLGPNGAGKVDDY